MVSFIPPALYVEEIFMDSGLKVTLNHQAAKLAYRSQCNLGHNKGLRATSCVYEVFVKKITGNKI